MDEPTDESLMAAVCTGDQVAYTTLVRRHIDPLYSYAVRLLRSSTAADDLVQETWLAVWRHARTFRPGRVKLTTWLHRILYNKYVDLTRRTRAELNVKVSDEQTALAQMTATQADPNTPTATLEREQQLQLLQNAIQQLPEQQKVALLLTTERGMSNKDIATIMSLSVRAVESLLARARRNLKTQLQDPPSGGDEGSTT